MFLYFFYLFKKCRLICDLDKCVNYMTTTAEILLDYIKSNKQNRNFKSLNIFLYLIFNLLSYLIF